jgi:Flp pilus assembly protein TadG
MALTLPLLLAIIFGIFDFGFMFQRYEVVTNAAREAARLGVLRESGGYTEAEARQRALDYLAASGVGVGGTLRAAPCTQAELPNSTCVNITWGTADLGGTPPKIVNEVTVLVQYDHEHVFVGPIMRLFGGTMGTVRLAAVSTMRRE